MKRIDITSAKLNVVFPEGKLPAIDPNDPSFVLALGGFEIAGKVNPKAARKLAAHTGGAVLYQVRKIRAYRFQGSCRLGKMDQATGSHQELDRCSSKTITASKNSND